MSWDQDLQVPSPVGQPIEALLTERPRRQALPGFEPVYSDIVDYILRCTHRIWEQKNIGLCRTHYADSCVMHTLAGPASGLETVVQGTTATLACYTDRVVVGEDVIWSEEAPGTFLSSHRITSDGTQLGDEVVLGAATLGQSSVTTIADCLCRENLIVEEWLVRDNIRAARQNGLDPWTVARAQAGLDQTGDQDRHAWRWRGHRPDPGRLRHMPLGRSPRRRSPARALAARPGRTTSMATPPGPAVGHVAETFGGRPNRHGWGRGLLDRVLAADPRRTPRPRLPSSITGRLGPCRTATSRSRIAMAPDRQASAAMASGVAPTGRDAA